MNTPMTRISSASGFGLWVFEYQKMHLRTGYLGSTRDGIHKSFKQQTVILLMKEILPSTSGKYPIIYRVSYIQTVVTPWDF